MNGSSGLQMPNKEGLTVLFFEIGVLLLLGILHFSFSGSVSA